MYKVLTLSKHSLKISAHRYTNLTARRPKAMPSSGPRLMVVRASRRAGACTLWALTRRAFPLPLRTKYTEACRHTAPVGEAASCPQVEAAGQASPTPLLLVWKRIPVRLVPGKPGTKVHARGDKAPPSSHSKPVMGAACQTCQCHVPTAAMLLSTTTTKAGAASATQSSSGIEHQEVTQSHETWHSAPPEQQLS